MQDKNLKFKVLCIEDEVDVRENIAEVLRMENFDVIEAGDAEEGLKMFMLEKPDIVVSDILMPKISGFDLLKQIRMMEKKYNPQVPFIFLSALGHKSDVIKGTNLSANDYLVKPVDLDILVAKVKEKLASEETRKESHKADIEDIYGKVSDVFLKELDSELNSLLKLIDVFKTEAYGPLGHRNYNKTANKIYLITQRLKTIANNTMDKNVLSHKMEMSEEIIEAKAITEDLIKYAQERTNRKIALELYNDYSHKIRFNLPILKDVLKAVLMQIIKITTEDAPVRINFFIDHDKNFVFAFHGVIMPELKENELNVDMEIKRKRDKLIEQGGDIDFNTDKNDAVALVSIPEYKVVR